jgi:hypothetical protein
MFNSLLQCLLHGTQGAQAQSLIDNAHDLGINGNQYYRRQQQAQHKGRLTERTWELLKEGLDKTVQVCTYGAPSQLFSMHSAGMCTSAKQPPQLSLHVPCDLGLLPHAKKTQP